MKNRFMNIFDAEASLAAQEGFQSDSWYYLGRLFDEDGDEWDYLLHNTKCGGDDPSQTFVWQQIDFTNITKGTRTFDHKVYPLDVMKASNEKSEVLLPESTITGTAEEMYVKADTPAGAFDLTVRPQGPVFLL